MTDDTKQIWAFYSPVKLNPCNFPYIQNDSLAHWIGYFMRRKLFRVNVTGE